MGCLVQQRDRHAGKDGGPEAGDLEAVTDEQVADPRVGHGGRG